MTPYLIGPPDTLLQLVPLHKLSKGTALFKKIFDITNENLPDQPLLPGLITYTYDSTLFCIQRKIKL